jgi:hypothetical protein
MLATVLTLRQLGRNFHLCVTLFLLLMRRDMLCTTLLGHLFLWPSRGSLVVRIYVTTSIPLVTTRAVVQTAFQDRILALI